MFILKDILGKLDISSIKVIGDINDGIMIEKRDIKFVVFNR